MNKSYLAELDAIINGLLRATHACEKMLPHGRFAFSFTIRSQNVNLLNDPVKIVAKHVVWSVVAFFWRREV